MIRRLIFTPLTPCRVATRSIASIPSFSSLEELQEKIVAIETRISDAEVDLKFAKENNLDLIVPLTINIGEFQKEKNLVLDIMKAQIEKSLKANAPEVLDDPQFEPVRKRIPRIEGLNAMIVKKKSYNPNTDCVAFSSISWRDVKDIIRVKKVLNIKDFLELSPPVKMPMNSFLALESMLIKFQKVFGDFWEGKDAQRVIYLALLLAQVAEDIECVRIWVEEDVDGVHLKATGRFKFVIQKGDIKICIVETKKEKLNEGVAQALVGVEALAVAQKLPVVYCIVTDFVQWRFYKSTNTEIVQYDILLGRNDEGMNNVGSITKLIYSILNSI